MSLLIDLWRKSQKEKEDKTIQQIIKFAGDGQFKDGSKASQEFRDFLSIVPSEFLIKYAKQCLENVDKDDFKYKVGHVLQDLVNQVGIRLGFEVSYGLYSGVAGKIAHDGLWVFPTGHKVIVEVKTTDAFSINLDKIANYRKQLNIPVDESSILLIVGRDDTGGLESQIRGSRHAWDMRLISVDALMRLMQLMDDVDDRQIIERIYNILIPREFTKLDEIIDIVFSTAEDIQEGQIEEENTEEKSLKFTPVSFHRACIDRVQKHLKMSFIKKSKTSYIAKDNDCRLICSVSKEYGDGEFCFSFRPHQKDFLEGCKDSSYIAFGCGDQNSLILIPVIKFIPWLDNINPKDKDDRMYWHVNIYKQDKKYVLYQKNGYENIDITEYLIPT